MTNKQYVLEAMKRSGKLAAMAVQEKASTMTGTELYAEEAYIPAFKAACAKMSMLDRSMGFVCKTPAERIVRLLQPYDSAVYTQDPEELPDRWAFVWSTDPAKARPFIAQSSSPYNTGDCCTHDGKTWRSGQDGNVSIPGTVGANWEEVVEA